MRLVREMSAEIGPCFAGEDVKVAYSCGGLISVKECENGRT